MQDAASNTIAQAQTLAATATGSSFASFIAWEAIGIGPAVLFMALTGTALGLLFAPPGGGRGRLFVLALIYTIVSAALSITITELAGYQRIAPVLALLLAFFAHKVLETTGGALQSRIRRTLGGDEGFGRFDDGMGKSNRRGGRDDDFDGTWKGD